MDENLEKNVDAEQGTALARTEPEATDEQITIDALKEVIAENKKAMDLLRQELTETKKVNAKLLAKMDVGEPQSIESAFDELFNKYRRK